MNIKTTISKIESDMLGKTNLDKIFAARCVMRSVMGKPDILKPLAGACMGVSKAEAVEVTRKTYPDVSEFLLTASFTGQLKIAEDNYIKRQNDACLTIMLGDVKRHYDGMKETRDTETGDFIFPADQYDDLKHALAECYPNVEREAILSL